MKKFAETTRQHEREWKEELKPLVEESTVPLIIAGDFNDTPASYIYQQATDLLSDPYVEQGRGFGTTYHGPRFPHRLHTPQPRSGSPFIQTHTLSHFRPLPYRGDVENEC